MFFSVVWGISMIDIHCHILYGVDDGSFALEETVKMVRIAEQGGTKAIIATPHCNIHGLFENHWNSDFDLKIQEINEKLSSEGINVEVFKGQEIFCSDNFDELLLNGELITLNNSRYPLVEFDFYEDSRTAYEMLNRLVAKGYVPIVAHPERYEFFFEEDDAAMRLKEIGCLLQVNKDSLNGNLGVKAKRVARKLIGNGNADFVASDAHSPYMRTPFLTDVRDMLSEVYSPDYAELLLNVNPRLVLENKEILSY